MTDHDPDTAVEAEFARFRAASEDAAMPAGPETVFAAARTRTVRRRTTVAVAAAIAVCAVLAVGTLAANNVAAPQPVPPAVTPTSSPEPLPALPSSDPGPVWGLFPHDEPTGLTILVPGWLLDIDAGTSHPVNVDGWLPRPGRDPLLVEIDWEQGQDPEGPIEVSTRTEAVLPGSPTVVRLNRPVLGNVAAAHDGEGVWAMERQSGRCTLREVDFNGQDRRPPRTIQCSLRLRTETAHGLWVDEQAGTGDAVLLDPQSLAELARYSAAALIDEHRVISYRRPWDDLTVHDLRRGRTSTAGAWVSIPDGHSARVGPVSPDGRIVPVTYMAASLPTTDIWFYDVRGVSLDATWQEEPGDPNIGLRVTHVAWAGDGRLVLLMSLDGAGYVVTWTEDEGHRAVPFGWPEPGLSGQFAQEILVLEP